MSQKRIDLHYKLRDILGSDNVYYQPPESIQIKYPAIIYSLSRIENKHADNGIYKQNRAYQITVIDKKPDHPAINKLLEMSYCSYNREFKYDNLHHTVLDLYW